MVADRSSTGKKSNHHPGFAGCFFPGGDCSSTSSTRIIVRPLACSAHTTNASSTNSWAHNDSENLRLNQTAADKYYAQHHTLPHPSVIHAVLPVEEAAGDSKSVLVIGDVHGCMAELQALHEKAIQKHNNGRPFSFVILVGDLCNKGPQSAEVVRWARTTPNVWSVRGNHDDAALAAALGDAKRRSKRKYQWVLQGEELHTRIDDRMHQIVLSDEDVTWLSELPYTLTIPGSYLGQKEDTLIVHAGLIPGQPLEDQTISTMVTIREVHPICDNSSSPTSISRFEYNGRRKGSPAEATETNPRLSWLVVAEHLGFQI